MLTQDFLDRTHNRTWRACSASTLEELSSRLEAPTSEYVLLICADTTGAAGPTLVDAAGRILASGAGYVCCWGPDCERLHDCFDEASTYRGEREGGVVMTTWHSNESIEEAAWFATHSAIPDERYSAAFASVVLATVGSTQWFAQLTGYLAAGAPMLDEA